MTKGKMALFDYLSPTSAKCLKGILAVIIVIVHLRGQIEQLNDTILGMILTAAGYLTIGIFFFVSGYGLRAQLKAKGRKYLIEIPTKRLPALYSTYVLAIMIYFIFWQALQRDVKWYMVLRSFIWGGTIVANGWYMQAIFVIYLIYFAIYYKINLRFNSILIIAAYLAICAITRSSQLWYNAVLCFSLGILWNEYRTKVDAMIARNTLLIFVCSFAIFCCTLLLGNLNILDDLFRIPAKMISAPCFTVLVMITLSKIRTENKITLFLGNISYELYLFHGIFLDLFHCDYIYIANPIIYAVCVMICSIAFAYAIHPLFGAIQAKIKGIRLCSTKE